MVFSVKGRGAENIEKKKKTDRMLTLKNEEKGKRKIQGMSKTTNIFGFTLYIKNSILLENTVWKKVVYTITFF